LSCQTDLKINVMDNYFFVKRAAKIFRWRLRRFKTALVWGGSKLEHAPIIFGNAMPKSGSHLLTQVLRGLTSIGPFVDPGFPPVNRTERNQSRAQDEILQSLQKMSPGDIRCGYLHARKPYVSVLTQPNWATIFIYRVPRDMLVSHIFYATEMNVSHGMHRYYTDQLTNMEERLNAAIEGVKETGYELASVKERYDSYLDWLNRPEILPIRFEDFILERKKTIERILDYLQGKGFTRILDKEKEIFSLESAIKPEKSGTFRKGQPGNWKEYFTEDNKKRFKAVAGDLLIRLGYEKNNDW